MSLWNMVSELSEMISLPQAEEVKATLQNWAEGGMLATVAVANMAVAGIQQRLMEAAEDGAPEGYEVSEPPTPVPAAPEVPAMLALPEPAAEKAVPAPAPAKRRKPLLLRLLFVGVVAAGAAAAAMEARKQLEAKRAAPPAPQPEPAPEAAAPAAASA